MTEKKTYTTKSGLEFTEDDIERWARAAEIGELLGAPVRTIVGPPGRPPLYQEALVSLGVKIPLSWREKLDLKAEASNKTRSEIVRELIEAVI